MTAVSQLALRDDRRRRLAFADLSTTSDAEQRENNCRSERELLHFCPLSETSKSQDRRGFWGPLVQKRHTSQRNRCFRTIRPDVAPRYFLYGVEMTRCR